jgi:hypothetical protein
MTSGTLLKIIGPLLQLVSSYTEIYTSCDNMNQPDKRTRTTTNFELHFCDKHNNDYAKFYSSSKHLAVDKLSYSLME